MEKFNKDLRLNDEFPQISTEEWEAVISNDLKGADYEKKLIWKTADGLKIRPYYRAEDLKDLPFSKVLPCQSPFIRGNKIDNNWLIRQEIIEDDPVIANSKALQAINKGAESLTLNVAACKTANDLATMLKDIALDEVEIHYCGTSSYMHLSSILPQAAAVLGYDSKKLKGSFNFDNLGYFIANGSFYASLESNFVELLQIMNTTANTLPLIKIININAQRIHNAGGLLTHELSYALSMGATYLSQLTSRGLNIDDVASRIEFSFAIGSNYFIEIAKIRAARVLWASIVEAYKPQKEISKYMRIHSITSTWNKTIYDPHVNMLRATTEAMSAAIGGCDVMTVLPFDSIYKGSDDFSERIARNLQIILKHEAYFNKIADVSAGSYYIENLTDIIAEAAWKMFLDVEQKGGFEAFARNGELMESLEKSAAMKQNDLANRRQILLGTNQFPKEGEAMLDKIQPKTNAAKLSAQKEMRLSQHFEAMRLSIEDYVKKGNPTPEVFLLPFGNLAMRKARAGFATNFFACAGYNVVDNNGYNTTEEAINAVLQKKAPIVVLCSSDEEYGTLGIEMANGIRKQIPDTIIIVAGNPTELIEQLKEAGVNEFIHMRTNILEALNKFNVSLGIY